MACPGCAVSRTEIPDFRCSKPLNRKPIFFYRKITDKDAKNSENYQFWIHKLIDQYSFPDRHETREMTEVRLSVNFSSPKFDVHTWKNDAVCLQFSVALFLQNVVNNPPNCRVDLWVDHYGHRSHGLLYYSYPKPEHPQWSHLNSQDAKNEYLNSKNQLLTIIKNALCAAYI